MKALNPIEAKLTSFTVGLFLCFTVVNGARVSAGLGSGDTARFAGAISRPQTPTGPFPYAVIDVDFDSREEGIRLTGTLTLPMLGKPVPGVILIGGSGPQDRDATAFGHKPFCVLADTLTRVGLGVLRYDDRGMGGSTGSSFDATTVDLAQDVLGAMDFLAGDEGIDAHQIGLIGQSEGAMVAASVAGQADACFLVLLASPGVQGSTLVKMQSRALSRELGADSESIAFREGVLDELFEILRGDPNDFSARKSVEALLTNSQSLLEVSGAPAATLRSTTESAKDQAALATSRWCRFYIDYDPIPALKEIRCPVLALNGDLDRQVPAEENLLAIRQALIAGSSTDITVRRLPGINHLFQEAQTGFASEYAQIEQTFSPVALKTICDWISERVLTQAPMPAETGTPTP